MGPEITAGAVIQHLAKVRVRLVQEGLPVPPPLRRGGNGRTILAAKTPNKNRVTKAPQPKSTKKKTKPQSDDSDEQEDWQNDDSDSTYGKPSSKRTKSKAKGPNGRSIKEEGSNDENAGDDTNEDRVAAGAGFLALEDDDGSSSKTAKKSPSNKKSLIVALPSTVGAIKEEEDIDMSDNEREADATGGGVVGGQSHGNFSTSPYNQNFANLAATQMEPATGPINTSSYVGTYNNFDHTSPQVSSFIGGPHRHNQSLFQQDSDDLDFDFSNPSGELPIDFDSDEYLNKVGITNIGTNFNGAYNGIAQQSDFSYQPTNAYLESPIVFGNHHHGHLPLSHWSNDNTFAGSSMATTANQTPAETSAGTDFGGYFPATQFQAGGFDGEAYDPYASHSMDSLNAGYVPDAFSNEYYGNGSYLN